MDELPHPGILSVKLLQESERDGKGPAAVVLMKQHGMRNMTALHHLEKGARELRIAIYFHQ